MNSTDLRVLGTFTDRLLDKLKETNDARIVRMVLRRQEHAFKRSLHGYLLRWPEPKFDVDQLLEVISPVRVTSFCSFGANRPPA